MLSPLPLGKSKRGDPDGEIFTTLTVLIEPNPQEPQMSRVVDQRGEIMWL